MAKNNRVFIAFAIEDERSRDFLRGQARNERSPFDFVDMSVKEPWDSGWKDKVRTRIKGCDAVIALVTPNLSAASGARFEMQVANEERIPMIGMRVRQNDGSLIPPELARKPIISWNWLAIAAFLDAL